MSAATRIDARQLELHCPAGITLQAPDTSHSVGSDSSGAMEIGHDGVVYNRHAANRRLAANEVVALGYNHPVLDLPSAEEHIVSIICLTAFLSTEQARVASGCCPCHSHCRKHADPLVANTFAGAPQQLSRELASRQC